MKINLNNFYYSHKSETCMNKDGKPLSVYASYNEAQASADYVGKDFIPYQCSKCGMYHLKPKEFYCEKVTRRCDCVDHNGQPKDTYKPQEDAQRMIRIRSKAGIQLNVYPCLVGLSTFNSVSSSYIPSVGLDAPNITESCPATYLIVYLL